MFYDIYQISLLMSNHEHIGDTNRKAVCVDYVLLKQIKPA